MSNRKKRGVVIDVSNQPAARSRKKPEPKPEAKPESSAVLTDLMEIAIRQLLELEQLKRRVSRLECPTVQ